MEGLLIFFLRFLFFFLELLNLCDPIKFKSLLDWDGSAINVQHIKLDLISYNMLQRLKKEYEENNAMNTECLTQAEGTSSKNEEESMET